MDHSAGQRYETAPAADSTYPDFAQRIAYLIDPSGIIRESYRVTDVSTFADLALGDLQRLQAA